MFKWALICAVLSTSSFELLGAEEVKTPVMLGQPEAELAALCKEMYSAFDAYYDSADEIKDEAKKKTYYNDHDPSAKYVEKLVAFERAHHSTYAGLMAVRALVRLGAGGGVKDNPCDLGRREALRRLRDYRNAPELFEIIRNLSSGNFEPEIERALQGLIRAPDITEDNRVLAKLAFANWSFRMHSARVYVERRLKQLEQGDDLRYPDEKTHLTEALESLPTTDRNIQRGREATAFLEQIATSNSNLTQPGVVNLDENWYLIRVDQTKTNAMPLARDLASGILFKENHLQIGKPAPELKLQLVSGEDWSLADQRGKTVIIQFSFKGCGPCEEMYPTLSSLADEHKGKLVVVSIMADENRDETTNAVSSGKLTWKICWDGAKGPVATRWAVTSFPTIYIVGPDGQIADVNLRGSQLTAKIAALTR
ncbi:TlpA family protein disulfide reductase [Schlesneria paludicola]|uniref:TlpA family protein disulfide reductase n=1 Tax=Schlesneria paludicola TaxID=360056 RepID=UPI00029A6882|nr:TlpA disulfide reductase family protein [Schlesneria paludicola]